MIALTAIALAGCLTVNPASDRITAGDLAAAIPYFTAPEPNEPVAFAPAPGVARVFHVPELRRLANRLHWSIEPASDICIERPVSPPEPAKFLTAMQEALPRATITLLDYGRQPLPAGELEFASAGLRPGTSNSLWTGCVRYAGTRRFTVWARVKVSIPVRRVIAAVDLLPGRAIAPEQLRPETIDTTPAAGHFVDSVDAAIGKWPRAAIPSGATLRLEMLEEPRDIARGDRVVVEVRNGAAHLELEGEAEASGSAGETIPVLNLSTHKRFQARVEGKGKVSVTITALRVNP